MCTNIFSGPLTKRKTSRKKKGTRRRRRIRGGAYQDLQSFQGGVDKSSAVMDSFNTSAGGSHDMTSAGNVVDARLESTIYV